MRAFGMDGVGVSGWREWGAAVTDLGAPDRSSSNIGHSDARHRPEAIGQVWPGAARLHPHGRRAKADGGSEQHFDSTRPEPAIPVGADRTDGKDVL